MRNTKTDHSTLALLMNSLSIAIGDIAPPNQLWLNPSQKIYSGGGEHPDFPLVDIKWNLSVQMAKTEVQQGLQAITPFYEMTCRVIDCAFSSYPDLQSPVVACSSGPRESIDLAVAKVSTMMISCFRDRYATCFNQRRADIFFTHKNADARLCDGIRAQLMERSTLV